MKKIRIMNQRAKLSAWKRTKYDIKRWWRRKKREIAKRSLLFWSRRLRFIESRFGSGIVSYFTLFRWLFLLDIGLGIFWLTFIVIFGIIYGFTNNNQAWNEFADLALNRNPSTNVTNPAMTILQTFTGQVHFPISSLQFHLLKSIFRGHMENHSSFTATILRPCSNQILSHITWMRPIYQSV